MVRYNALRAPLTTSGITQSLILSVLSVAKNVSKGMSGVGSSLILIRSSRVVRSVVSRDEVDNEGEKK